MLQNSLQKREADSNMNQLLFLLIMIVTKTERFATFVVFSDMIFMLHMNYMKGRRT